MSDNFEAIRRIEFDYLLDHSNIPVKQREPKILHPQDVDLEAFKRLAYIRDNIVDFTEAGHNLYICSKSTGTGKTTWAIKILMKYFNKIWPGNGLRPRASFEFLPLTLSKLKDFSSDVEAYKTLLKELDLIVWDDIASTKLSDYELSTIMGIIDYRILNGKSNIYTSNVTTLNQLSNVIGSRLASRIYNTAEIVTFNGGDMRAVLK